MASLSLRHIYKIYSGGVKAVSDFNLEIEDKEFIVFVGPSGCGKSTTLRMIAGLEEISDGELYIDGRLVNDVEPKDRDIAMVFQNYALYPHMTVYDNMAFGLRLRRMPSAEIDSRVKAAAQTLGITVLLDRKPKALSGGQRQRVALGRAIVREPKVFLLDEPLSNLDAKLRVQMRTEITKLHNRLATTFIYVTHDQTEAMTMGTRIVVMKDGLMQQVDTPQNLFDSPCNQFVATFIGTPQMNLFDADLEKSGNNLVVKFGSNRIELPESKSKKLTDESYIGKKVIFGVRPEDIHDEEIFIAASPKTVINAEIDVIEKLGNETIMYTKVDGKEDYTVARVDARAQTKGGDVVKLAIDANHVHLFDPETELAILGLPQYNFVPAKLDSGKDGGFVLSFGKNKLELNSEYANKLTEPSLVGGNILIGIKPEKISTVKNEEVNSLVLPAELDFVEDMGVYKTAYFKVDGKTGMLAVRESCDFSAKSGSKVKLYFEEKDVVLFDADKGVRVTSTINVPQYNVFNSTLVKSEGKNGVSYSVNLLNKKVALPSYVTASSNYDNAAVELAVDPKAVVFTKEQLALTKAVFKVMVHAVDNTGTEAIIYGKVDGTDKPFYARVSPDFKTDAGYKAKFGIKAEDIKVRDASTGAEVIAAKPVSE